MFTGNKQLVHITTGRSTYVAVLDRTRILFRHVLRAHHHVGKRTSVVHEPATFMQQSTPSSTQILLTLVGLFQLKVVRPKSCGHKHELPLTNIFEFVSTTSCHPIY